MSRYPDARSAAAAFSQRTVRLSPRHERWTHAAVLLLSLSGAGWLLAHYFFRTHGEFGDLPSPAEAWMLRAHGAAAMLALVITGSLLPNHVQRALATHRNLASGLPLLALMALLTASGYGLYYIADETLRPTVSLLHWIAGLLLPPLIIGHVIIGKRRKKERR